MIIWCIGRFRHLRRYANIQGLRWYLQWSQGWPNFYCSKYHQKAYSCQELKKLFCLSVIHIYWEYYHQIFVMRSIWLTWLFFSLSLVVEKIFQKINRFRHFYLFQKINTFSEVKGGLTSMLLHLIVLHFVDWLSNFSNNCVIIYYFYFLSFLFEIEPNSLIIQHKKNIV